MHSTLPINKLLWSLQEARHHRLHCHSTQQFNLGYYPMAFRTPSFPIDPHPIDSRHIFRYSVDHPMNSNHSRELPTLLNTSPTWDHVNVNVSSELEVKQMPTPISITRYSTRHVPPTVPTVGPSALPNPCSPWHLMHYATLWKPDVIPPVSKRNVRPSSPK